MDTRLGATITNDTHYNNESVDQEAMLNNLLLLPRELIENIVIGRTNITNELLDVIVTTAVAVNNLILSFESPHKAYDVINNKISQVLINTV